MIEKTDIKSELKRIFGFEQFKPMQEEIISAVLGGENVFVLMPTGGGKSLCYQLPALMSEGTAVVISPLIALMKNQVDALRQTCNSDGVAHFLNSSLSRKEEQKVRNDISGGITKLLYLAPESLQKKENIAFLKTIKISFFAIDEAHCISEWGHDFRPEYRKLRSMMRKIGRFPVMALTATATEKVRKDIQHNLGITRAKVFRTSFNREGLFYEIRPKSQSIDRDLIRYIKQHPGKAGIIYCLSRKKVDEMAEMLSLNGISCLPYHAGLDAAQRAANQDAFLHDKVNVMIATIAFGMGIDKADIRFVIHYDIPKSLEGYYQETGRAGRDGAGGHCLGFFSRRDIHKLDKLLQSKTATEQKIGRYLLKETALYAESSICRRKLLLHYFGEKYEEASCDCCDNCVNPVPRHDVSDEVMAMLELVDWIGDCCREDYLVHLLLGRNTDEVKMHAHNNLDLFGALIERDERYCRSLIRQVVIADLLNRGVENFGLLSMTPEGRKFMEHPRKFMMLEEREMPETYNYPSERTFENSVLDPELYSNLRDLRRKVARRLEIPPYVVFSDSALETMATIYPMTSEELTSIPGVGTGKAKRFGNEFLTIIKDHVTEHNIIRPEDIPVRSIPKRNNLKVAIIQAVDRKMDLVELAESKGLEFGELLTELESIVQSGVRLDISYYVNENVDEDLEEEMIDFFRSQEEDDIEEAYRELGADVDEERIRLVRIKFISEMGN